MSELRPRDQARLRRVFRYIDEEAPLSPGLDEIGAPAMEPARNGRTSSWWVAAIVFAGTLLLAVPVALVMNSDNGGGPLGAPTPTTDVSTTTTTSMVDASPERLPLDGRPSDLGVESIDFAGAVFPTSIREIRMVAVWEAARTNVESGWVEACMEALGAAIEIPRITAYELRRQAAIPDFELDAEFGFYDSMPDAWTPTPPAGSTPEEADEWNLAYTECSDKTESTRSQEFDQVVGQTPSWFDLVDQVTASQEMQAVTDQMLRCIADAGGPKVDTVTELYSDRIAQRAESPDAAAQASIELAQLIEACAGDYDEIRLGLLLPKRGVLMAENADILARAELYFNQVLLEAGVNVNG